MLSGRRSADHFGKLNVGGKWVVSTTDDDETDGGNSGEHRTDAAEHKEHGTIRGRRDLPAVSIAHADTAGVSYTRGLNQGNRHCQTKSVD